ncbi:monocarboxylate transporter 12 [Elysia marginata]|uniref:Monocarboxylate transporter 12 n=1 Tax=Elysia marginata TaxID=1093978 RepID=A0AAV4HIP7_9GAST|nr:monocarboxylate transporter 12 [Elysia marginata]
MFSRMEGLIDALDTSKWEEITAANKPDGFVEFHVNPHAHKQVDKTTFSFMIESDDESASKVVTLHHAIKDPIKKANMVELRLSEDKITGIDLDGDIVILKS